DAAKIGRIRFRAKAATVEDPVELLDGAAFQFHFAGADRGSALMPDLARSREERAGGLEKSLRVDLPLIRQIDRLVVRQVGLERLLLAGAQRRETLPDLPLDERDEMPQQRKIGS